jgi:NhaP-type Na+/H+ or K+/H+ antiporter/rhodanese-related sulfurtransferase
MDTLSAGSFAAILALMGIVIVIAGLLSGFIERSNAPQVAVFLGLGAVLGPSGLGVLNVGLHSPILQIVATLSLVLVLFTDAVSLNVAEMRRQAGLALRVLGPGTLLSAVLIGLAAWQLLHLSVAASVLVGAALASTDPVLLRGLLRRNDIPSPARQALRLESGLNDVVLLPIVLVAMQYLLPGALPSASGWVHMGMSLFLLGPAAGIAVGLLGVATLDLVRRRVGIRRDYESLYSLGVAFAAYAAAETVHGSGFLAVFAAGLTISALDVELCDCFLEYGETTAELALLFSFVLLGSSLIWSGFPLLSLPVLLFALLTLFVRPVAFVAALAGTKLGRRAYALISWFGPRGLSTLLLVLLPVFAGVPGSDRLFSLCCLVVVFSVCLHGGSLMVLNRKAAPAPAGEPPADGPSVSPAAPRLVPVTSDGHNGSGNGRATAVASDPNPGEVPAAPEHAGLDLAERMPIEELQRLMASGEPVFVLDARSERSFLDSASFAGGAIRIDPDRAVKDVTQLKVPKDARIVPFCACPNDKTSVAVAQELRKAGWPKTQALLGGWEAWQHAGLPVEVKAGL